MAEDKKAPAEEEEWTPLKRPLLLLGSLSLASSYACACVTFGPAMVLYALPERSEQLEEKLFFLSSSSSSSNDDNDDNNNRNNRNNRNNDDSSKRREEREKETKRKNKEMLERMKRVKL
ncbi:unnamed protein product [Bathycoccus prasinos]